MISFLRAHPTFRRLWLSRSVSFLGDSVGLVALLLFVAQRHSSALAVALLMIAGDFVPNLLSPFAGAVADRVDARRLMLSCEVAQAAIVAVIAASLPGLPLLLPLVALRASIATVFQAASRAVVPSLVAEEELGRANATIGAGTHGLDVIGPLVAAALVPWLGVPGLLFFDAATFAASAGLLATLPINTRAAHLDEPESFIAGVRGGMRYIWRHRTIRVIAVGFCTVVFFNGVDDVALVYLARDSLGAGDSATSVLFAGVGAGLLVGFAILSRLSSRLAPITLLVAGFVISSLGNLLTGVAWAVAAAVGFQAVRGMGLSLVDTAHDTLIQRAVPAGMLGRVFSNIYGAVSVSAGLSYVFGGMLLDATSPRTALVVAGAGGIAATGLLAWRLRQVKRSASGR